MYEVKSSKSDHEYTVDLAKRTCTCRAFQKQGYPCAHAAKVILTRREQLQDYVECFFTVTEYRRTYAQGIYPPSAAEDLDINPTFEDSELSALGPEGEPNSDDGDEPDNSDDALLPPSTRRPPGRPRKRRIRNAIDIPIRNFRCSRCRGLGHSRRTCNEAIDGTQ